jgi:hypothetical protein
MVPASLLVVVTDAGHDAGAAMRAIAIQDLGLDTTKPFRLEGSIAVSGNYDSLTAALLYGMSAADSLRMFASDGTESHYKWGSEIGVRRKEFAPTADGQYRFYFEVDGLSLDNAEWGAEWAQEFTVVLYDDTGWEVGSFKGKKSGGFWGDAVSAIGTMPVQSGKQPTLMRIFGPWYSPEGI